MKWAEDITMLDISKMALISRLFHVVTNYFITKSQMVELNL